MKTNFCARAVKFIVLAALAMLVFGVVFMWLWNALIPQLFNGPEINYWQALGLLILSKIIFGGLRGKSFCHHHHNHWKNRMYKRMENMTEEEKDQFKKKMQHCGWTRCDEEI